MKYVLAWNAVLIVSVSILSLSLSQLHTVSPGS